MNRLNDVRDNLVSGSAAWTVAVAVAIVGTIGMASSPQAAAAESSVVPTVLMKTRATPVVAGPMYWQEQIETIVVYEVGRYAWHKYEGPKFVKKCYDKTRQGVGWVVRSSTSAAKTVTEAALLTVKEARSQLQAAFRWLRE